MERKDRKQKFRNWKRIRQTLFRTEAPVPSVDFTARVMARLDERPVPVLGPRFQWAPVRIAVPLAAAAMLVLAVMPAGGSAADWMLGSDGMSRYVFAHNLPANEDVFEFVMEAR